jgi:hypothetical protein
MRVILLLCCFVFPSYLAADVFIYHATGVIDSVIEEGGTDADGLVVPGERFTMRFTLDTNESLGQFDDLGPYNQTKHYIQSYPISVQFSGGFSFVATPPGTPWWVAEQARTVLFDTEVPNDQILGRHHSGHNSEGTLFDFNTPITADWIDMIFGFEETSAPYQLVSTALTGLPELAEIDQNWFSLTFLDYNPQPIDPDFTAIFGHFDSLTPVPGFDCVGFSTPFDEPMVVNKKSNKALPLKFNLYDGYGTEIIDLSPPPMVEVREVDDTGSDISGWNGELIPAGLSDDGNEFRYNPESEQWILNLGMKAYTASTTYTISVIAGDDSYVIDGCTQTFTRQN